MQSQARQRKSRRVLIVDDNAESADLLGMYLQLQDFEVAVAHDGSEAIGVAQDFRPTIVVCELRMPRMDGIAVAKALTSDRRRFYLVAHT
jgi:two-component system CheB/CheR fusion protein